jgi:purine-nucleoside phosphorylase
MMIDDVFNLWAATLIGTNRRIRAPLPGYDLCAGPKLKALARETAKELGIPLEQGVYCWLSGPSYVTPAEIRALRILGVGRRHVQRAGNHRGQAQRNMKVLGSAASPTWRRASSIRSWILTR